MTTQITRSYTLATLLRCHCCASPLRVQQADAPTNDVYRCTRENADLAITCATPDIRARQLENWLIQEIAEAVLTPKNLRNLRRHIAAAGYTGNDLDVQHIREAVSDPLTYTAPDVATIAQDIFLRFIDHIEIQATQAIIHYSIPLPPDGPQPGSRTQTVTLPAQILT